MKYRVGFNNEAQELINNKVHQIEVKAYEGLGNDSLTSYYSKQTGTLVALAGVLHFLDQKKRSQLIEVLSVQRAIKLCEFLEEHAINIYLKGIHQEISSTKIIYQLIIEQKIHSGMTLRELYRAKYAGIHSEETAIKALRPFIEDGAILIEERKGYTGRSTKIINVNPLILNN
jgi:hypothetical protein